VRRMEGACSLTRWRRNVDAHALQGGNELRQVDRWCRRNGVGVGHDD
jgi:hypothetical protein